MSARRDEKIDALKCLAMFLVVLGHAIVYTHLFSTGGGDRVAIGAQWIDRATLNSIALNVAYSVHMPLFAFLSAYVLWGREGRPLELVKKRAVGLLVPYVVWIVLAYVVGAVQSGGSLAEGLRYVGVRLLYPQSPGAAWFLYALFGCFVVFAAVRALGGGDRLVIGSAVVLAALIVVPTGRLGDILGIFDVAWLYPFFAGGYLFAKHAEKLAARRRVLLPAGLVLWFGLMPLLWPVLVPEVNWWYPALREYLHGFHVPGAVVVLYAVRYTCAAAGIVALFFLYDFVRGTALSAQAWVGRRTLGMYVIQTYVLLVASPLVRNAAALTVITFLASLALTWLLERTRGTRFLFLGQRSRRANAARSSLG